MKTDSDLRTALRDYVSPRLPFGPVDSANIDEPECQARLFEWQNTAFIELLRGSNVIVGRRGSGKSALVKMVRNSGYLESRFRSPRVREYRDAVNVSLNDLSFHAALVVDVDLPQQMFEMEIQFSKIAVMPRVEVVAQHWTHRLFFLIGDEIRKSLPKLWALLPTGAQRYITAADLVDLDPSDRASTLSASDFSEQIRNVLTENRKKVILTFDSLEDYRFDKTQNVILSGLFRAVGQLIARQKSPVDVKLCLPAEIYEFIKPNVLNPDKDVTKKQFLHWTAIELMHIAAHRLRVYFEVFEPEEFAEVRDMHLRDRQQLRTFWRRYLPAEVTNRLGVREDTFRYILRHSQMLPRHVIMIMNSIFERAYGAGAPGLIGEPDVLRGVLSNEVTFCDTIIKMFEIEYPQAEVVLKRTLPRLPRIFPFGLLEKVWREEAKPVMANMGKEEFWQFARMMLATGTVGLVEREQKSDLYLVGRFEFNSQHELVISDKDTLCIHPLFSGIYNSTPADERRVVLPRDIASDYVTIAGGM